MRRLIPVVLVLTFVLAAAPLSAQTKAARRDSVWAATKAVEPTPPPANTSLARGEELQIEKAATRAELERQRLASYHARDWSQRSIDAILAGTIHIGMLPDMVRESWGEPSDINRTILRSGTTEQWVYRSGSYVYFENGVVDAIQN